MILEESFPFEIKPTWLLLKNGNLPLRQVFFPLSCFRSRQIVRTIQNNAMFSSKQLSEDQIAAIKSWAADGAQLPEIQKKITEDFKLTVTYMDTRFAILDLGIELVEPKKEQPAPEITEAPVVTGKTTVTMDSIAVSGTMVSGRVVFSDGETALWSLDETGRPSLDPAKPDYQPIQEDIVEFQTQLRALIQSTGL